MSARSSNRRDGPLATRRFKVKAEQTKSGASLISVEGEVDRSSAGDLSNSLRRVTVEETGAVIVDLCQVSFLDSSGISVLLNALRRLTRRRRRLLIACPPGNVMRVFELTGLTETFAIFPSRDDALSRAA